jgi:hypothetical protein
MNESVPSTAIPMCTICASYFEMKFKRFNSIVKLCVCSNFGPMSIFNRNGSSGKV